LKVKATDTKSFFDQLNQITETLLAITPAQREVAHGSIRATQTEMTVNELFHPYLIIHLNVLIATPHILKNGVEPVKHKGIIPKTAKRPLTRFRSF